MSYKLLACIDHCIEFDSSFESYLIIKTALEDGMCFACSQGNPTNIKEIVLYPSFVSDGGWNE